MRSWQTLTCNKRIAVNPDFVRINLVLKWTLWDMRRKYGHIHLIEVTQFQAIYSLASHPLR